MLRSLQYVTALLAPGTKIVQLVCGRCQTLLMYLCGVTKYTMFLAATINLVMEVNQSLSFFLFVIGSNLHVKCSFF
ncbi:hypothetical protein BRADI_3g32885v3 [Brachypodium distachyon]|uniref:Uncharacterized protein n=1 Tax=Brachypodium distachyon TaxID=15368 RepID=A0A2K2D0P8_BRADI|nr:hypothetical protein BRADI_3g32885v3 [Brachypodium distachyon]